MRVLLVEDRNSEKEFIEPGSRTELRAHLDDAAVVTDLDGTVCFWNEAATRLFGRPRTEALGTQLAQVLNTSAALPEAGLRAATEGHAWSGEFRPEGTCLWADVRIRPVIDAEGKRAGTLILARDIGWHKRREAQYRQAEKMDAFAQVAGGVAHEFNNLLTIINGYCEIVLTELSAGDALRPPLAEIEKAGARAAVLTRQLLAFTRQQVLAPRLIDLNSTLLEMSSLLRQVLGPKIELTTRLKPAPALVHADPGEIEQVFTHLAVNARAAMPDGGTLIIEAREVTLGADHGLLPPGSYIAVTVTDSGHGMSAAVKARIFEPFFTTKEVGQGSGLGLATVYGIVKQSGGHVGVDSAPGKGATFTIYLPSAATVAGSQPAGAGHAPVRGTETVLLVEDDRAVGEFSRHVLEQCGYRVLYAVHPAEAHAICSIHSAPIHLLLTDVVMPETSGHALAAELIVRFPEMRVLFVSGYTADAEVLGNNSLQKPFSPRALANKVREVLDGPPPGRECFLPTPPR